jgi:lipopolysaccharide export system ATP-binding protein
MVASAATALDILETVLLRIRGRQLPLLEVENLTKVYSKRAVVDHVSYFVNAGEVVGLLGPNGAGKTTTFRMTVGMITPTDGRVIFAGEEVSGLPMYKRARRGMGYLSQEPSIFQKLTVEENIVAVLQAMKLSGKTRRQRAAEALEELDLSRLARHKGYTLSGGERRRLEITRALICTPSLLLLDEPFSGVDPIAVLDIQQIVLSLRERGIGILLTDHSIRETLSICDRSYIINEGKVLTSGTSDQLVNDPIARKIYLGETFLGDEFVHRRAAVKAIAAQTEFPRAPSRGLAGKTTREDREDAHFRLPTEEPRPEYHPEAIELDEIEKELARRRRERKQKRP